MTPQMRGIHPAARVQPPPAPADVAAIAASIAAVGQLRPLAVTETGLLIDGRARAAACAALRLAPLLEVVVIPTMADAVRYLEAVNIARRSCPRRIVHGTVDRWAALLEGREPADWPEPADGGDLAPSCIPGPTPDALALCRELVRLDRALSRPNARHVAMRELACRAARMGLARPGACGARNAA